MSGDRASGAYTADGCSSLLLLYSLASAEKLQPRDAPANPQQVWPRVDTLQAPYCSFPPPPSDHPLDASAVKHGDATTSSPAAVAAAASAFGADWQLVRNNSYGSGTAVSSATHQGTPVLSHRHTFIFEFPEAAVKQQQVKVKLLGPLTGAVGEPLALTWQLTRVTTDSDATDQTGSSSSSDHAVASTTGRSEQDSRAGAAGAAGDDGVSDGTHSSWDHRSEDEILYYEVDCSSQDVSEGPGGNRVIWDPGMCGKGSVRLGRQYGAMATVEAVVMAVIPGRHAAPQLSLRGIGGAAEVPHDGVTDDKDFITVMNS